MSRVEHGRKIRSRIQGTDIGNRANRAIQLWNELSADALGTLSCELSYFREQFRK
jgi:hypothetical protein